MNSAPSVQRGSDDRAVTRTFRVLAWSWLLLVVVALAVNAKWWLVERRGLETDFLALLPAREGDAVVSHAFEHVTEAAQQNVLVLVGAPEWPVARAAAEAYMAVLSTHADKIRTSSLTALTSDSALAPWWRNRRALLTDEDRAQLRGADGDDWSQRALQDLMSPIGTGRIGAWQDDPFGLFRRWLRARAAESPVRPMDGVLRVDDGDLRYVVLPMRLDDEAFALSTQRTVEPLLAKAKAAALAKDPTVRVLSAGMIFPAAAAAAQANREFSTIGWGSILGIVLLTWITFRSLRPIGLVLLSLGVGTLAALAVTAWLYPQVHLITLVFGASLIGVAEDYGMHYLCIHDRHARGGLVVMRDSLPGLALALLTTIVSFFGLGLSPFPGLQQMAVFSAVGLSAAWITVVLWFPLLDGPQVGLARVVTWFNALRLWWQRLLAGRARWPLAAVALVAMVIGLRRLVPNDDIRLLQSLPAHILQEQVDVGQILQQPFEAQFFVVRAPTESGVLEREEALRVRLDSLVRAGVIAGYSAVSSWVPSPRTQHRDRELVDRRLLGEGGPLDHLRVALGEAPSWSARLRADTTNVTAAGRANTATVPLTIATWLASPVSEPMRPLWLGPQGSDLVSVVTLKNVDASRTEALVNAARDLPGVVWADQVASISHVLGRYRERMSWVLLASYGVIWLLFLPRYGRSAWRVLAPSITASLSALAVVGLLGEPLQLFHILALYLVFGIGVDFAIFLSERTHSKGQDVWFAVGLAATSTVLSLGLLALSDTPVLHAFGLVMLVGVVVSMVVAPLFCSLERSHR